MIWPLAYLFFLQQYIFLFYTLIFFFLHYCNHSWNCIFWFLLNVQWLDLLQIASLIAHASFEPGGFMSVTQTLFTDIKSRILLGSLMKSGFPTFKINFSGRRPLLVQRKRLQRSVIHSKRFECWWNDNRLNELHTSSQLHLQTSLCTQHYHNGRFANSRLLFFFVTCFFLTSPLFLLESPFCLLNMLIGYFHLVHGLCLVNG